MITLRIKCISLNIDYVYTRNNNLNLYILLANKKEQIKDETRKNA